MKDQYRTAAGRSIWTGACEAAGVASVSRVARPDRDRASGGRATTPRTRCRRASTRNTSATPTSRPTSTSPGRRARRVPRRRPVTAPAVGRVDRSHALGGVAGCPWTGASRSPCPRTVARTLARRALQHRLQGEQRCRRPYAVAQATRPPRPWCLGGFSHRRLRRLRAAFGDRLCSSFGPVQMASLRSGARVPFGGQLAQVPVRVGRLTIVTPGTVA